MKKEIYYIICIVNEQEKEATVELIEKEEAVKIKFYLEGLLFEKEGDNYFDTLSLLREELEKKNMKLLCKGCCKNVFPSGMILNMGVGRKAYTLAYGKQAKMDSLVDIFDACSIEEYASIKQQLEYFENWTSSLRR